MLLAPPSCPWPAPSDSLARFVSPTLKALTERSNADTSPGFVIFSRFVKALLGLGLERIASGEPQSLG